jgi:hypothetical protein
LVKAWVGSCGSDFRVKNSSQSEGVPHLEAWVSVGRGIPHGQRSRVVYYGVVIPKNKCVKKKGFGYLCKQLAYIEE